MNKSNLGIDYSRINVKCPYEMKSIKSLKIVEEINNHSVLSLVCYIDEKYITNIINSQNYKDKIEIKYSMDGKSFNDLFKGTITKINIKCIRSVYFIEIEAMSCTYEVDIKKHTRIFQDNNMLYKDLCSYILKEYKGADFIDSVFKSNKIKNLIVQYQETDWEFLKRISSHFNKVLIVNSVSLEPKFTVGHSNNNSVVNMHSTMYSISKNMKKYNNLKQNSNENFSEQDFICYHFTDENYLMLGQKINIDNKNLFIKKVTSEIKNGLLKFEYEALFEKAMETKRKFNRNIIGKSFEGKVTEIKKDEVKVDFQIDKVESKEKSMLFKYSTLYSSEGECGWFFMPEKDDIVAIYFPNENEGFAIASFSTRKESKGNSKVSDPNTKIIGTNKNKELKANKSEISFNAQEGLSIKLSDGGIEICSTSNTNFDSKSNITINGNNIDITAGQTVHFINGKSNLIMDGNTHTRGGKVHV